MVMKSHFDAFLPRLIQFVMIAFDPNLYPNELLILFAISWYVEHGMTCSWSSLSLMVTVYRVRILL